MSQQIYNYLQDIVNGSTKKCYTNLVREENDTRYTPQEVLEMWDICGKEYSNFCGKTCDGLYSSCSECIDVTDNEMLLNFLVFMGVEV